MCSIHKSIYLAAASLMVGGVGAGCQSNVSTATDDYNNAPLVIDEAMQRREWEPVTASYESGDTVAGPTGFKYVPRNDLGYVQTQLVEPALFVGQVLILPINMIAEPPGTDVVYRGAVQEPTYTAVPPLETDFQAIQRENAKYRE
jgi:hypothetical protein